MMQLAVDRTGDFSAGKDTVQDGACSRTSRSVPNNRQARLLWWHQAPEVLNQPLANLSSQHWPSGRYSRQRRFPCRHSATKKPAGKVAQAPLSFRLQGRHLSAPLISLLTAGATSAWARSTGVS